jgi:hypothetical protein
MMPLSLAVLLTVGGLVFWFPYLFICWKDQISIAEYVLTSKWFETATYVLPAFFLIIGGYLFLLQGFSPLSGFFLTFGAWTSAGMYLNIKIKG